MDRLGQVLSCICCMADRTGRARRVVSSPLGMSAGWGELSNLRYRACRQGLYCSHLALRIHSVLGQLGARAQYRSAAHAGLDAEMGEVADLDIVVNHCGGIDDHALVNTRLGANDGASHHRRVSAHGGVGVDKGPLMHLRDRLDAEARYPLMATKISCSMCHNNLFLRAQSTNTSSDG